MKLNDEATLVNNGLKCNGCGSVMYYTPGAAHLTCTHCGVAGDYIPPTPSRDIHPVPYDQFLADTRSAGALPMFSVVTCNGCGSQTIFNESQTAGNCAFCASPLVVDYAQNTGFVKPHYVLPFNLTKEACLQNFQKWLSGLWFAPSNLSKVVNTSSPNALKGIYLPYWMYDSNTLTHYNGKRGEYYYTTETYTVEVSGQKELRTREVRHTRWYPVSGDVECDFRDIIIPASNSLPKDILNELEPWGLHQLQSFDERFLSGFSSETFQVSPEEGLNAARQVMAPQIRDAIMRDIGGDEQEIFNSSSQYDNAIKYVLLPVWASSYIYNGKNFQFAVNATTGEVIGKRPYSALKITFTILFILVLIAAAVFYFGYYQKQHG